MGFNDIFYDPGVAGKINVLEYSNVRGYGEKEAMNVCNNHSGTPYFP